MCNTRVLGSLVVLLLLGIGVGGAPIPTKAGERWVDQGVAVQVTYLPSNCSYRSQEKDILTLEYVGKFLNGTKFDSTYDRNMSMIYTLGGGEVIRGCEIGTLGMCLREKRRLIVPPGLGYGSEQYGIIPPDTTLTFEIELTDLLEDPFRAFDMMDPFASIAT